MTIISSHYFQQTLIGSMHSEKIGKAILFYVFAITLPASLWPDWFKSYDIVKGGFRKLVDF